MSVFADHLARPRTNQVYIYLKQCLQYNLTMPYSPESALSYAGREGCIPCSSLLCLEIATFHSLAHPLLLSFNLLPHYQPVLPATIRPKTFMFVTIVATFLFINCHHYHLTQSIALPIAQFIILWLTSPCPSPLFCLLLTSHFTSYYRGFVSL